MPGTPAPSPPPSPAPKTKKLQFQTDQSKPFVLPFAPANAGPRGRPRAVPASIDEAGELYRRNMRISTELWQTWKLREEYMAEESGLLKAARLEGHGSPLVKPTAGGLPVTRDDVNRLGRRMEELSVGSGSGSSSTSDEEPDEEGEDAMDPLAMLRKMERGLRRQEDRGDVQAGQRRRDVQRLIRVEQLYVRDSLLRGWGIQADLSFMGHSARRCRRCKAA